MQQSNRDDARCAVDSLPEVAPNRGQHDPASRVLVVSHASIRSINRGIYRRLAGMGCSVNLLIAEGVSSPSGTFFPAEPLTAFDPPTVLKPMRGRNLRFIRFDDFEEVLDAQDPHVVVVEYDPASLVARDAIRWCSANRRHLVCRTNENLSWLPADALKRGGWRELPSALAKSFMHWRNREHVAAVCTTSIAAAELFRARGYKNVVYLPMGTDRQRFRYRSAERRQNRERLGIGQDEHVVAYFGRMVPEKGVETLVEALRLVADLPWRFLLNKFEVASDYAQGIEDQIAASGISDRVIRAASRHGQIAELMTAADVVVLPSRTTVKWVEQFGRVVPEAMASGALVLVSDSGAPKELVADPELVFAEGNASELAALLRRFAAEPRTCKSKRSKAMRRVQRHLSTEVEARLLADVIGGLPRV